MLKSENHEKSCREREIERQRREIETEKKDRDSKEREERERAYALVCASDEYRPCFYRFKTR